MHAPAHYPPPQSSASSAPGIPPDLAELQLLDKKQVCTLVGLKSTAVEDRVRAGTFPAPVRIGSRFVRWPAGAVRQWLQEQIAAPRPEVGQRLRERAVKAGAAGLRSRQAKAAAKA